MIEAVFYFFAVVAVLAALLCITQRNAVSSAIWLVVTMLSLAAIFVLLGAHFIGIIQVLVYAGAIMVLFLFVIMLLNLGQARPDLRGLGWRAVAVVGVALLAAQLLPLLRYSPERLALEYTGTGAFADPARVFEGGRAAAQAVAEQGVAGAIARPLFEVYLVPFELTSILLLAAIVGAVVLAKRRI